MVRLDDRLLNDAEDERGLPQEFLNDLVARSDNNPDMIKYFQEAIQALSSRLSKMTMSDNYKPYISALGRLVAFRPLVDVIINAPSFLPEYVPPHLIEKDTLLGPFFQLSPVQVFTTTNLMNIDLTAEIVPGLSDVFCWLENQKPYSLE